MPREVFHVKIEREVSITADSTEEALADARQLIAKSNGHEKPWKLSTLMGGDGEAVDAKYTSVHDDFLTLTSPCKYNPVSKTCFDIGEAEGSSAADHCDALTDEYVTVDGKQLREKDGVTFDY